MEYNLQQEIIKNPKMYNYLKEHSYWLKYLNRNPYLYKEFMSKMKEIHHERVTDKISNAMDNMSLIESILESLNNWQKQYFLL